MWQRETLLEWFLVFAQNFPTVCSDAFFICLFGRAWQQSNTKRPYLNSCTWPVKERSSRTWPPFTTILSLLSHVLYDRTSWGMYNLSHRLDRPNRLVSFLARWLRSSRFFPNASLLAVFYTYVVWKEFCRFSDKFVTRRLLMYPGYQRPFFSQVRPGVLLSAAGRQILGQRSKSRSSPELKSSPTLVNSQLVRVRPVGILNPFVFVLINMSQEFARPY